MQGRLDRGSFPDEMTLDLGLDRWTESVNKLRISKQVLCEEVKWGPQITTLDKCGICDMVLNSRKI